MQIPNWVDLSLKIFMPLLTFVLGVYVSRRSKIGDTREKLILEADDLTREHVANLLASASDWYTQLVELRGNSLKPGLAMGELFWGMYMYVNKRTALPKMQLSLEVLKRSGKYPELVATAEKFLMAVTIPDGPDAVSDFNFGLSGQMLACLRPDAILGRDDKFQVMDSVLKELDRLVQKMFTLAGSALSESRLALIAPHSIDRGKSASR